MNVSSGASVKSLLVRPLRRLRRASRIARRLLPAAHEAVKTGEWSGTARIGGATLVRSTALLDQENAQLVLDIAAHVLDPVVVVAVDAKRLPCASS